MRCSTESVCWASVLGETNRIEGREAASQIASASTKSFLLLLTKGRTNCGDTSRAIKVPHNTRFDPKAVKKQLGIAVSGGDEFMYRMRHLAERKVQWHEALGFFMNVLREVNPSNQIPEQLPKLDALATQVH
jgi:hypothetical protein